MNECRAPVTHVQRCVVGEVTEVSVKGDSIGSNRYEPGLNRWKRPATGVNRKDTVVKKKKKKKESYNNLSCKIFLMHVCRNARYFTIP